MKPLLNPSSSQSNTNPQWTQIPKPHETSPSPAPSPSPSHFSFAITKVAVSQICQSIGFKGTSLSALETLTKIATLYLQTLAKSAAAIATSSGRTNSNLFDLIYALEDLAAVQGFPGGSNLHHNNLSLLKASTLVDLVKFVESIDEIPFAKPIPNNKRLSCYYLNNNCDDEMVQKKKSHIPMWLPPFPDLRTEIRFSRKIYWPENSVVVVEGWRGDDERGKWKGGERGADLQVERERVRFKMGWGKGGEGKGGGGGGGVALRNGICRGGKRVSLHNGKMDYYDDAEDRQQQQQKRRRL